MSFWDSSQEVTLEDNILRASCQDVEGNWQTTEINLNDFLGNSNGIFEWGGGGWHGTATNYRLEGPVLVAQLDDGNGEWPEAKIDLNERITNNNGQLEFLG
ncbi:Cyanovirin-N [Microdochium trichocladiopsis]|uniref:Cyanovirin-N n=1 Tax=Microdochium trichocladiopsis TaxID=1682393 RepID=A0A9P8XZE2_9PEZI|nr:Cyanovirin-N [Microdochium trichocladiopsis]KAH7025685.1 Cyanovirin-N [Microdochium trichocladiopsis]